MRIAMMKKTEINKLARSIELNTEDKLLDLGELAIIDCADMAPNEKRAYIRGYERAKEES